MSYVRSVRGLVSKRVARHAPPRGPRPSQSCERNQHKDLQYAFGHNKALAQSKRVLAYSNERKERYPRSAGLALATQDGDVTLGRRAEQTTVFATEL